MHIVVLAAMTTLSPAKFQQQVRAHWCTSSVDYCDGQHGYVHIGSLSGSTRIEQWNLTMRGSWRPATLRCWRMLLPSAMRVARESGVAPEIHSRHPWIYTFGVFQGDSMYYYGKVFPEAMLLGFDSFTGLPAEQRGEVRRATWNAGTFGLEVGVADRIVADLGRHRSRLIRGFFNETLTSRLAASMRPAALVDIDSDIYLSASQALDWLFAHKLAAVGTLIAYDDWADYACAPKLSAADVRSVPPEELEASKHIGARSLFSGETRVGRAVHRAAIAGRYPRLLSAGEPKAHAHAYANGTCTCHMRTHMHR